MENYDIKCRILEEELSQFWPQWHVTRRLGGGSFGDVYEVYRDNYGIRLVSAVKVIQIGGAETLLLQGIAQPVPGGGFGDVGGSGNGGGIGGNGNGSGQNEIPVVLRNEIQIMEATLPVSMAAWS